ncbi:hypothetical protein EON80_24465 [bacterium]|nr:MAG: hypothetical protein EON80_24465 [bacterium]
MKTMFCWRCQMEIPMLDEAEYAVVYQLYRQGFHSQSGRLAERFRPLVEKYNELTGFGETNHLATLHHRIAKYGSPCTQCGKPLRSPKASFCAACGADAA